MVVEEIHIPVVFLAIASAIGAILIVGLVWFVKRNSTQALCQSCERTYSNASPFIEGESGALICSNCSASLSNTLDSSQQQTSKETSSRLNSDNPYQSPAAKHATDRCDFCGWKRDSVACFGQNNQYGICYDCIQHSLALVHPNTDSAG